MTVYVLSTDDSGACKIGYTDNWPRRLMTYECHAYEVTTRFIDHDGGVLEEEFLFRLFAGKGAPLNGKRREWFMLTDEDLKLLWDLSDGPGLWSVASLEGSGAKLRSVVRKYVETWRSSS